MERLMVDWKALKEMGWPYSRSHTDRLEDAGRFPQSVKLGDDRNSHRVWPYKEVVAQFKRRGLPV